MITTVCKISYGSQTVPPIVPAVQGDTGRAISFEIADFTPPAGATATYFILKPSGEAIYNSATITDNSILCELTAQSLAEAGENRMQVRVLQGENIVTSFEVILMVRTFLGDDAIESGTEMNIFDQAVEQATEQFQENAEQIVEEVIESIPSDYTALTEEVDELNERLTSELNNIRESGGVNLFNVQEFASDNDIPFNNGVLTAKASVLDSKKLLEDGFKPNTAYTVSFYGKNTGNNITGNGLGIQIKYTDSGNITTYLPNSSTEPTKFTLSSNAAKTIDFIQFYYNSGATNVWELTEIQIEEGNVATEYANYYSAVDAVARKSITEANVDISTLETITLQATERRIDSESLYQSFNDLPINKIVNLFSNIKLADGPQGYVPIGHNNINDGNYNATVITYSAESNSRAIAQVCIFYVLNGYDYDKRPRTATRYGIKSGDNIVWSEWSTLSSSMVLHSSDKVVDVNSYSTVTFADFNDAEPNAIYQVDLNVGTTILNNPSPGHSGLLMTFSFSPVSHHALVQNFYALEDSGIEMYFRYGYKQSSPTLSWTPWKKVTTTTI